MEAVEVKRSLVRIWGPRGTLHLVAAEDVRWLLGLIGPPLAAAGRRRRQELGIDEELAARGLAAVARVLSEHAPLTRWELMDRLEPLGVRLDRQGQAPIHLIALAGLSGVLCHGPERPGGEPTYVLMDDWVPRAKPVDPGAAAAELAHRYLVSHAPAGPEDLSRWSGLPLRSLPRLPGESPGRSPRGGGPRTVHLLPAFDPYLLGYRDRRFAISPDRERQIQRGGGWIHPLLLIDGRVAGTWRLQGDRIEVEPYEELTAEARSGLAAEAADIGRFRAAETELRVRYTHEIP